MYLPERFDRGALSLDHMRSLEYLMFPLCIQSYIDYRLESSRCAVPAIAVFREFLTCHPDFSAKLDHTCAPITIASPESREAHRLGLVGGTHVLSPRRPDP